MGPKTQEITSGALSANHPSFYRELQLSNCTPVEIIVTTFDGSQYPVPPCAKVVREQDSCIDIEYRGHVGMRSEQTEFGFRPLAISGTKITIPFECIKNAPYKVHKHNIILSTVDHSYVAKEMLRESMYNPVFYETRFDDDLLDPRLVFQVIDPANQWSELYVNVFGQTIVVRAGRWASVMPSEIKEGEAAVPDPGRLLCYLRYPNDYYNKSDSSNLVFEVSLENIQKEEPIMIPGGDTICVASSMEALKRILVKKNSGNRGNIPSSIASSKMIPKDLYDAAQNNFKAEIERMRQEAKTKLDTTIIAKDNEIAKLQAKLDKTIQEKEALETQNARWESLNKVSSTIRTSESEQLEAVNRARKAAADARQKEIDNAWAVVKIGASAVASIAAFAITAYVKSQKK